MSLIKQKASPVMPASPMYTGFGHPIHEIQNIYLQIQ